VRVFCTKVFLAAFSSYVLALAENLYEKFARKMLVKLTPAINLINVKCERSSYKRHFGSFFLVTYM